MPSDVVTYVLALTIGLLVTYCGRRYRLRHSVFPPGPPRKPIIGNLEDIRYKGVSEWKIYTKWKEIYGTESRLCVMCYRSQYYVGDLVGLKVFGTNIVILNSEKAMRDLLETRGAIYSDRPKFTVLGELMGLNRVRSKPQSVCSYRLIHSTEHGSPAVRRRMARLPQACQRRVRSSSGEAIQARPGEIRSHAGVGNSRKPGEFLQSCQNVGSKNIACPPPLTVM